ncbi:MAG: hypothetical protein AUG51_06975 [Acidobacteria bacterium 13_1_20CM_3_53_8]|nr:MAG: hypothetical protein AUG51_06975 [Acidobacteria bacterium 13_1_20CM_3_53_8]
MKVAILSESSADESAIRIILEALLGRETEGIASLPLRSRGWPSVIRVLPTVLKYLHYRTDAEALVVIVDSDDSTVHQSSHDEENGADMLCRLCQLRNVVSLETTRLRPVAGRSQIKVALGLAVPAIEAWYLCGSDPHVNEAAWARRLQQEQITYTRRTLKEDVYGTERPTIELEMKHATNAARQLINELSLLEQLFPNGFGSFARDVRDW